MNKLVTIAKIITPYSCKFGIPRQSGIVTDTVSKIIFEPEYRNPDAVRGLEGFSHIWVLWQFSKSIREGWSPTVRPPRLGGNKKMGVFATRSPFRPNSVGLSSLKLEKIEITKDKGPILFVSGADILDGTPVYDIKPYLAFTDSHPEAIGGFADDFLKYRLNVKYSDEVSMPAEIENSLSEVLSADPRPSYQDDGREYSFEFSGYRVKFTVYGDTLMVLSAKILN